MHSEVARAYHRVVLATSLIVTRQQISESRASFSFTGLYAPLFVFHKKKCFFYFYCDICKAARQVSTWKRPSSRNWQLRECCAGGWN
ncbi:hypothetical protein OUZ56_027609 [Daphnia magna]|uniref:Secreted protein n=1 Tax=Daphnia magna TaxID=35525 RepID=A0ABR0B1E1_9CRUS|nr:hypothetical protein OUZ56_027609 [Daphnia magna]